MVQVLYMNCVPVWKTLPGHYQYIMIIPVFVVVYWKQHAIHTHKSAYSHMPLFEVWFSLWVFKYSIMLASSDTKCSFLVLLIALYTTAHRSSQAYWNAAAILVYITVNLCTKFYRYTSNTMQFCCTQSIQPAEPCKDSIQSFDISL